MNIYCEVKFANTQMSWLKNVGKHAVNPVSETTVTSKNTQVSTGQNPKWNEQFSFSYQKLTKLGHKQLQMIQ